MLPLPPLPQTALVAQPKRQKGRVRSWAPGSGLWAAKRRQNEITQTGRPFHRKIRPFSGFSAGSSFFSFRFRAETPKPPRPTEKRNRQEAKLRVGSREGKEWLPILMVVTRRPQALSTTPMLLAVTPLPRPLTTPPVTSTYFMAAAPLSPTVLGSAAPVQCRTGRSNRAGKTAAALLTRLVWCQARGPRVEAGSGAGQS